MLAVFELLRHLRSTVFSPISDRFHTQAMSIGRSISRSLQKLSSDLYDSFDAHIMCQIKIVHELYIVTLHSPKFIIEYHISHSQTNVIVVHAGTSAKCKIINFAAADPRVRYSLICNPVNICRTASYFLQTHERGNLRTVALDDNTSDICTLIMSPAGKRTIKV
ncbi:hypothetical protein F2P81_004953 [Scophthalmus maximus]|uniref:Uncharacterized protein n=1 Tax=Scophthalmus maximus TaxID=52904 RepID=A0A6A4T7U6_SCOMX|nr:hypothetical protein F2P81_004953 [Scophthalmus maximus]